MITTVWPWLAVVLLAAGVFPTLERSYRWRVFALLPPIVWTYLFVTALAVSGLWVANEQIGAAQRALTSLLLPALLFLLVIGCDLRAILALGPRVLAVFACAMLSILLAFVLAYLMFRSVLPEDGWKMLAALSATWTGGSANLVAVKQSIGLSESSLPPVLLADAICYSTWIVLLFATAPLAPAFARWTGAPERVREVEAKETLAPEAPAPGTVLLWLGAALAVGLVCARIGAALPPSSFFTPTSWTVLLATLAGLVVARTPLARIAGPAPIASALLACLVAVLASQSNFAGLSSAPLFVLVGFCVLAMHALLLLAAARAFRFDLHLCGISSLAQVGGPATAPVLAATYDIVLVPVAVLLAALGLVLGTPIGLAMAHVLSVLAPVPVP